MRTMPHPLAPAIPPMPDPDPITMHVRSLVERAERIVVLTGAGVSAESGVPTFRGNEGLWRSFRPERLATPEAFAADPTLVWSWYRWRRARIAACRPNAAHRALARLALSRPGLTLVTQNVDGLHELAAAEAVEANSAAGDGAGRATKGADRLEVLALHGSLYRSRCSRCGFRREEPRDAGPFADRAPDGATSDADVHAADLPDEPPPPCPECGAPLRPDVVWFGESLDPALLERAWTAAAEADLCLVVGTSGVVQPAASLASVTARAGGRVVEVNPEATPLTPQVDVSVRRTAAAALPALLGLGDDHD